MKHICSVDDEPLILCLILSFLINVQCSIKRFMKDDHNLFQCGNGGCLIELAQQLAVIMIGKKNVQ